MKNCEDFLFEIGTEELPATQLADIFEGDGLDSITRETIFEIKIKKAFQDFRINFQDCRIYATPRRIIFLLKRVAREQSAKENMIKGPSKQEAYTDSGAPTEKLLGFLKSKNVLLNAIEVKSHQGRDYIFVNQREVAKKTEAVIPDILQATMKSLSFPKMMRWDSSGFMFPRPIRSYLCFFGDRCVRFMIGLTEVSDKTYIFSRGIRTELSVKNIDHYFKTLDKHGIVYDSQARKKLIQNQLLEKSAKAGGRLVEDAFLLNEVNYLLETPETILAPFHESFLELPPEVLTVSMARKQRIFGLVDAHHRVLPSLLGVLDGEFDSRRKEAISKKYEQILHAKLQDSLFFYKEDTKTSLEARRPALKDLIFIKNAGSMLEKSDRLTRLAEQAARQINLPKKETALLSRAALLCKSDLLTHMVGEFPELQGIIGGYYASENKEEEAVAKAISEHYLPRTVQDRLPQTLLGNILSVLDKVDLVTACFGLGLEPSSSVDPYGLRRSATAVIKILIDQKLNLSISFLCGGSQKELGLYLLKEKTEGIQGKLKLFFMDRFKAYSIDKGFREDVVDAVLASDFDNCFICFEKMGSVSALLSDEHFPKAWKVVERTANIVKGSKEALPDRPDPKFFVEEVEKKAYDCYLKSARAIEETGQAKDYKKLTYLYSEAFFDILNEFFEKVFVNAEDVNVRRNRLVLLRNIRDLYTKPVADVSKIRLV